MLRLPKLDAVPQMRAAGATNDIGEFRVAGSGGQLCPGHRHALQCRRFPPTHPVPTFYPGVTSPDQAQPIVVERGMSALGLQFR